MNRTANACRVLAAALTLPLTAPPSGAQAALLAPTVASLELLPGGDVRIIANVPPGFRNVVLETYDSTTGTWQNHISGALNGANNAVTFLDTVPGTRSLYRVTAGESTSVPTAPLGGAPHFSAVYNGATGPIVGDEMIGHVLNRLAYGPTPAEFYAIKTDGVVSYIDAQLDPAGIDESGNTELNSRVADQRRQHVGGHGTNFAQHGQCQSKCG